MTITTKTMQNKVHDKAAVALGATLIAQTSGDVSKARRACEQAGDWLRDVDPEYRPEPDTVLEPIAKLLRCDVDSIRTKLMELDIAAKRNERALKDARGSLRDVAIELGFIDASPFSNGSMDNAGDKLVDEIKALRRTIAHWRSECDALRVVAANSVPMLDAAQRPDVGAGLSSWADVTDDSDVEPDVEASSQRARNVAGKCDACGHHAVVSDENGNDYCARCATHASDESIVVESPAKIVERETPDQTRIEIEEQKAAERREKARKYREARKAAKLQAEQQTSEPAPVVDVVTPETFEPAPTEIELPRIEPTPAKSSSDDDEFAHLPPAMREWARAKKAASVGNDGPGIEID